MDAFAALIAEDPGLFKNTLFKKFAILSKFFEKHIVLENEQNLFVVGILDVLLLKNDLMGIKTFTLEQAKRLFREFM